MMEPLKAVRRVSVISINERWHATPLFEDGTAGHSQRFTEASAAWDWACTIYPGIRITVQAPPRYGNSNIASAVYGKLLSF